jgi:hypothetical protein
VLIGKAGLAVGGACAAAPAPETSSAAQASTRRDNLDNGIAGSFGKVGKTIVMRLSRQNPQAASAIGHAWALTAG